VHPSSAGPNVTRFYYGPIEWLWRTLTFFEAENGQAIRVAASAPNVLRERLHWVDSGRSRLSAAEI
jgi:hypothetical protein